MNIIENILGEEYKVKFENALQNRDLEDNYGICYNYDKQISIKKEQYKIMKETIVHEVVHAYLNESGLSQECCDWHCEEMVDWIAIQLPKINKTIESIISMMEKENL